jgi:hypothetical protein
MIDELSMTDLHRQTDATAGGPFEENAQPLGTVQSISTLTLTKCS